MLTCDFSETVNVKFDSFDGFSQDKMKLVKVTLGKGTNLQDLGAKILCFSKGYKCYAFY